MIQDYEKHEEQNIEEGEKEIGGSWKRAEDEESRDVARQITDKVRGHAAGMVETTIAEADKGHFATMKYLFEMIGLYPAPGEEEPEGCG